MNAHTTFITTLFLTSFLFQGCQFDGVPNDGPGDTAIDSGDSDTGDTGDSDTLDGSNDAQCACEDPGVELSAIAGCENFGGDEETCSGWRSCEEANGISTDSTHESGTALTCFGCTILMVCP